MRGLVPRIPLRWARLCVPKRDGRVKLGHDKTNYAITLTGLPSSQARMSSTMSGKYFL